MGYEITGTLVEKFDTIQVSDKFKKREFVIEKKETNNGMEFVEHIKFQLIQDKCALIESYTVGEGISISFNIKGRKWEKDGKVSYFINLDAWNLVHVQAPNQSSAPPVNDAPFPEETDDLPFS